MGHNSQYDRVFESINANSDDFKIVRPGEVCSIATAKALGVFDIQNYYPASMNNTRTYSDAVADDARRPNKLCHEYTDDEYAQPVCPLVSPGLQTFVEKDGFSTCRFPTCPTGFVDKGNGVCEKPIQRNILQRAANCQEQWHDWFTVPNYHMGNGYSNVAGSCFAPCRPDHVPFSGIDPDTGKDRGESQLDKCVDKVEYLGGKFAADSDHCTIAWVKRLSADSTNIPAENKATFPRYLIEGSAAVATQADRTADVIMNAANTTLENVGPDSLAQAAMCKAKVETPERLADAYAICEQIKADGANGLRDFKERMKRTFPRMLDETIEAKWRVLNQACHYSFCDKDSGSDRAARINRPQLCFPADAIARVNIPNRDTPPTAPVTRDTVGLVEHTLAEKPEPKFNDVKWKAVDRYKKLTIVFSAICVLFITGATFYYFAIYMRKAFGGWEVEIEEAAAMCAKNKNIDKRTDPAGYKQCVSEAIKSNPQSADKAIREQAAKRRWDIVKTILGWLFNSRVARVIMAYVVFFAVIFLIVYGVYRFNTSKRSAPTPGRAMRNKCRTSAQGCGIGAFGIPVPAWMGGGRIGGRGARASGKGGVSVSDELRKFNASDYATTISRDPQAGRCDNKTLVELGDQCVRTALPQNIQWKLDKGAEYQKLPQQLRERHDANDTIEIPWTQESDYLVPDCAHAFYKADPLKRPVEGLQDDGTTCYLMPVDGEFYDRRIRMKGAAIDDFSDIEYLDCDDGQCALTGAVAR